MPIKKYRVINQSVEINDTLYAVGDELRADQFRPASGNTYINDQDEEVPELSEIESLLSTGKHIEEV